MLSKRNKQLKILKVIHGYPPYYLAGSEIYSFNLCNELSKKCEISIFTRVENDFQNQYEISESYENNIRIIRVNKPNRDYTFRSKYIDKKMEQIFEHYLLEIHPDIVHIGHLSHLTVTIVSVAKKYNIPVIFTLHDYWMMCIRGQLVSENSTLCDGPNLENCIECNKKYFLSTDESRKEIAMWIKKINEINHLIDIFIAPSNFLREKYIEYGIPENKIKYLDYGFDTKLFENNKKKKSSKIRFGFVGRIIPIKGIKILIDAFNEIDHSKSELKIFGTLPKSYAYLKEQCKNKSITFYGGFDYNEIANIFSQIDILIVPSLWYENSPLVIHEAFLSKIPVITSNIGGMSELIQDKKNGLLFEIGNKDDLKDKLELLINNSKLIEQLSSYKTYVRSISQDAEDIMLLYQQIISKEG
ncbi:MAG: glycosyltransferase family 4 protein [Candidatus Lokiarchaeota archaeon]|nr:glycosyltransferase family 4 protein [Candidatus Lokiarchaeota archaeon]